MSTKRNPFNWQYALGEVVLIFIGISLAISFQNWNDDRRLNNEANLVLESLKENLQIVSAEMDSLRAIELYRIETYEKLLDPKERSPFLSGGESEVELWEALFAVEVAMPKFTAYEEFKNSGKLSLIKDQQLQKMMVDLEFSLDDMRTTLADRLFVQQTMIDPLIIKYFNVPAFLAKKYDLDFQTDVPSKNFLKIVSLPEIQNIIAYKVALGRDHEEDLSRVLYSCKKMIERLQTISK